MTPASFHETSAPLLKLWIPRPAPWITANKKGHWTGRASDVSAWKYAALIAAHQARAPKGLPLSIVQCVFHVATNRHRDPGNFTPTTKAIIDGLARGPKPPYGYGVWDDDDPRYLLEMMPRFLVVAGAEGVEVIVALAP